MFAEARDVARDGIFSHFSRFVDGTAIGNAARKNRNQRGVATFGFRPEHDVVVVPELGHETDTIALGKRGQTRSCLEDSSAPRAEASLQFCAGPPLAALGNWAGEKAGRFVMPAIRQFPVRLERSG